VSTSLLMVAASLVALGGLALVGAGLRFSRVSAVDELLAEFDAGPEHLDEFSGRLEQGFSQRLLVPLGGSVLESVQGLLPRHHLANIRRRLVLAGLSGRMGAEEYVAGQVIGLVVGTLAGLGASILMDWSAVRVVGAGIIGAVLGVFAPYLYVKHHRQERVEAIEKELPDVLDVLAISVEAGVGLEGAMLAVTERFTSPLSAELGHTLSEMELGLSRREALQNLRSRTDIPDLNGFILALLQADALGMPMARVLQTQAEEMRRRRRGKVREAAAKLPVKLVFPLVMFILPALFVVILGPAVISIAQNLMGSGGLGG
jgi:tight adherence protein C